MGQVQPLTIIDDPSAWRLARDYPDPAKLAYVLNSADIAELDAAVATAVASGKEVQVNYFKLRHVDAELCKGTGYTPWLRRSTCRISFIKASREVWLDSAPNF